MGCSDIVRRRKRSRDRWKKPRLSSRNGTVSLSEELPTRKEKEEEEEREKERETTEDEHSFFILFKENSTIHGVRDLFVSPRTDLKLIWILFLIIACFLTFHGCSQVITEFMHKKVVVSYFVHSNDSLEIPDIIVCPLNRFNRSFFERYNMSEELRHYVELSYPGISDHPYQARSWMKSVFNKEILEKELNQFLDYHNTTFTKFITDAAVSCNAFLAEHECKVAEEAFTFAGKCFRLPGKQQHLPGFGHGRRVKVHLPKKYYHPGANNFPSDGIIVKLAASNKGIDNDLAFVPIGTQTIMSISATKYSFLNDPPKFSCAEGDNRNYSRVWCFESCLLERAEASCNCSITTSMFKTHKNFCTPADIFDCYVHKNDMRPEEAHVKKQQECKKRCTAPCEYWTYSKTLSYSTLPAPHQRELMESDEEYEEMKNTIVIDAFYTDLEYTVIKHMRNLPLSSAIAQFGGQLSLWAGASVMSMAQLVIYVVYILVYHCLRLGERKRQAMAAGRRFSQSLKRIRNRRSSARSPVSSTRNEEMTTSLSPRCAEEEMIDIEEESSTSRRVSIAV